MAATLALTSSGNISPVSDLGVVPSDGSPGSPLMAATLALAPGLERLLTLSQGRILDFRFGLEGGGMAVGFGAPVLALIGGRPQGTVVPSGRGQGARRPPITSTIWTSR